MYRKIILKLLIAFSILTGLTCSAAKAKKTRSTQKPLTFFVGKWTISEPNSFIALSIQITDDEKIYLNEHILNGQLTTITEQKLVFKDHYGYELIVSKLTPDSLNLFDEADEKDYLLLRQHD